MTAMLRLLILGYLKVFGARVTLTFVAGDLLATQQQVQLVANLEE